MVEASLDQPIGSSRLEELVRGKKNIVIISSDHTRPVPSKIITPILLRRIREATPDANIKILVATGFHRASTHQELIEEYGQEIVDHEQIVMHVATDDDAMIKIGTLPSGGECIVNRPQLKRTCCWRKASLSHICSLVFPAAGNRCSRASHPTRPSWLITAASSNMFVATSISDPAALRLLVSSLPSSTDSLPGQQHSHANTPAGHHLLIITQPNAIATGLHLGFPIAVRRGEPDYWPLFVASAFFGAHRDNIGRL